MNRSDLLANLDNPRQLEKLYRDNKTAFKTNFNAIYPELKDNKLAAYWHERLNYQGAEINWGSNRELVFVIIASLCAAFIAKLPATLHLNDEFFYPRNIGFIVFPALTAYFIWRQGLSVKRIAIALAATLLSLVFINLLPQNESSDTLVLSCIHLPLFLWSVLGFCYVGDTPNKAITFTKRLNFLRYNGDLVIMTGLILIAGVILTGVTIGLFSAIGLHIEEFYGEYIAVCGAAAAPILATYITQTNPQLVSKVSPVIAKIFSPLVLITLVAYLIAIPISGKDPYNDRDFLLIFNFLLIGVMALILFSVAETLQSGNKTFGYILFALSAVTVVVNAIALSAILFRISEWGFTPNRLAVLGANILMLANLLLVAYRLFKHVFQKPDITSVENAIAMFLPLYVLWTAVIAFVLPLVFQFR